MNIFEFIKNPYSLRKNSQFRSKDQKAKICHRHIKMWHKIFLQMNVIFSLASLPKVPENSP